MSDLRPLSDSVARLTKGTFSRKFISLGRILSCWAEIVGPEMADRAQPMKLNYRKPKSADEKPMASLDVSVSSADAAVLHYQKDLILERINQIFGEKWIQSLRFVHVPANTSTADKPLKAQKPLSDAEKAEIASYINAVEDPEIRKRLEKLGEGVLRKLNK